MRFSWSTARRCGLRSHYDLNISGNRFFKLFGLDRMRKLLLAFLGLFLICTHVMARELDFRCLISSELSNPVRLQFDFPSDDGKIGYVSYQKGSGKIQVKNTRTKETRRLTGGRPSEFETEWVEVTASDSGGRYLVKTQAARIYDFKYIRKKDGRVFRFVEDLEASGDNGCTWH